MALSTRATSSKHFLHASDYPFPQQTPDFPYHHQVLSYLDSYAQQFDLKTSIRFNTRVSAIRKAGWRWRLDLRQSGGVRSSRTFDAVVICAGPHQSPRLDPGRHPLFRRFPGEVMHAGDYKNSSSWIPGERVLVVGAGESAADIVSEAAQSGAHVYWSSRHGQWFADRNIGPFPADHFAAIGIRTLLGRFFLFEHLIRRLIIGPFIDLAWGRGGHGIPEWEPSAPYLHQFVNKSRDAVLEFYRGRVSPRRAPTAILGKRVFFQKGDPAEVDRIVLATGYEPGWEMLGGTSRNLFKLVFDVEDPTLACVGFVRPVLGSIPSLAELQARWLAQVWSGKSVLPAAPRRRTIAHYDREQKSRHLLDSSRLGVLVDQEVYASQLASFVGAEVPWLRLLLTDFQAFRAVLWSPWTAFKYRLSDSSPAERARARRHIVAEMPEWRRPGRGGHPVFLLVWGILGSLAVLASGLALALWTLPPAWVAGGIALIVLGLAWRLRTGRQKPPLPSRKSTVERAATVGKIVDTGTRRAGEKN